jgi:PTH1 family peptidyl-tRNA hydrolase
VGEAFRFYKLDLGDVVVFHDELDLAPGKVRVKTGGGVAGHNGLKSLSAHIGNDYARVRIGIGHPGHKDLVSGYVLHDFAKADYAWLEPLLGAIAAEAHHLAVGAYDKFQSLVAHRLQAEDAAETELQAPRAKPASRRKQISDDRPDEAPEHNGSLAGMLRRWLGS